MTRHQRIIRDMTQLARLGVIEPDMYTQGDMPGVRWNFVPTGFSERSLTTSQVEDFILGAMAALNAWEAKA